MYPQQLFKERSPQLGFRLLFQGVHAPCGSAILLRPTAPCVARVVAPQRRPGHNHRHDHRAGKRRFGRRRSLRRRLTFASMWLRTPLRLSTRVNLIEEFPSERIEYACKIGDNSSMESNDAEVFSHKCTRISARLPYAEFRTAEVDNWLERARLRGGERQRRQRLK